MSRTTYPDDLPLHSVGPRLYALELRARAVCHAKTEDDQLGALVELERELKHLDYQRQQHRRELESRGRSGDDETPLRLHALRSVSEPRQSGRGCWVVTVGVWTEDREPQSFRFSVSAPADLRGWRAFCTLCPPSFDDGFLRLARSEAIAAVSALFAVDHE